LEQRLNPLLGVQVSLEQKTGLSLKVLLNVGGRIILPFGRLILPIFLGNVMLLMPTVQVKPKLLFALMYKIHHNCD